MIDWSEEEERREQLEKNQKEVQKAVFKAYETFFESDAGQIVWADLCVQYNPDSPPTITNNDTVDVNATLISVGQHNVLKYIMNHSMMHDYSNSIKQRQEQLNVRRKSDNIYE